MKRLRFKMALVCLLYKINFANFTCLSVSPISICICKIIPISVCILISIFISASIFVSVSIYQLHLSLHLYLRLDSISIPVSSLLTMCGSYSE